LVPVHRLAEGTDVHEEAAGSPDPEMILLDAVVLGLAAGLARARVSSRSYHLNPPGWVWLLFAAVFLQATAFYFPATRRLMPDWLASLFLVGTQICLLAFIWLNRKQPGFVLLGAGLTLNLVVIITNGGWMPVSSHVVAQLSPNMHSSDLVSGMRVGWSKDILLLPAETRLGWFSDCLLLPSWFPQRAAFSLGDILIALGAFWALWTRGGQMDSTSRIATLMAEPSVDRTAPINTGKLKELCHGTYHNQ
jgi:hypothetical protein